MDKKIVHLSQLMQLRRNNGFKSIPGNWCAPALSTYAC